MLQIPEIGDGEDDKKSRSGWERTKEVLTKMAESAGITFASIAILGIAGMTYHYYYKRHVVKKMDQAFDDGDPAFELTMHRRTSEMEGWVERRHQKLLDDIIAGRISGRYYLLIGEKGTGKTSMILEAMRKCQGSSCTILDAHADPEIFRIRLGKALDFEFHEDYIGSLFSIRGPRDTTALLDIERAFNKLEEVAVGKVRKTGRPLVMVINNAHLIRDDADGNNLVELLQQKAEALSGAGLVTIIFNSDDYWLYERLKKLGTRLEVVTIKDLDRVQSVQAFQLARLRARGLKCDVETANRVYDLVGGRPQHLAHVAGHKNILKACQELIDREKTWFLNQCGLLGEDMDDDVMESGKFSTSAMFLMRELVEMDRRRLKDVAVYNALHLTDHKLPELPLWRARQVMTRPDYIQVYDNLNIFTIDSLSRVRADSVPMMQAFHEIADMPGFDDFLEETADRVSAIESLGRTRELVAKDLVEGGKYTIKDDFRTTLVKLVQPEEEEDKAESSLDHLEGKSDWWSQRVKKFTEQLQDEECALKEKEANAVTLPGDIEDE
ncbi:hypothetical protein CJU90_4391 [Yarrowia sp. C11]|nr:hypothetical protein CKK34_6673 [Yarrowia sp. E02]KAG5365322.1 hypothetical protein CJU90_4391 [Yarrowia sp. C11]